MARDKKSFLLYTDLIFTVEQLSDEKAGQLFKFLLSYVNDEDPTTDDLILNLTFEPIKQQFKRDLIKYEVKKEGYSKAGKASAEARKLKSKSNEAQRSSTNSTNVQNVEIIDEFTELDSLSGRNVINRMVERSQAEEKKQAEKKIKKEPVKVSKAKDQISVILPFDTDQFKKVWSDWKTYKLEQHGFKYKSDISEGLILKQLNELSGFNEFKAIQLIEIAIAKGWKGFHETNNSNYATNTNKLNTTDRNGSSNSIARNIDRFTS